MGQNDKRLIRYAEGTGKNLGKAKNRTDSWGGFKAKFRNPTRTAEKQRDYQKASEEEQKRLKSVDGWIYRTQIDGAVRNRGSGKPSDLVTFDFDYATPEFLAALKAGEIAGDLEWFAHSTRRHTAEKPRLRMMVPLKKPVTNEFYNAVSRILALQFDPSMTHVDKVSFRPAQMMFKPTASKDQDYEFVENSGQLVDWEDLLEDFEMTVGDWRDISTLPTTPGEHLRETAEKAENPLEKEGPVGDFCRAYDIPTAIEKFGLPYEPVEMETGKPRYTFTGGTTTNGAEVQDGGLFLYSHHGSDPCGDMLVNAFDLVRIHKFGDLDKDVEPDSTPTMSKWPSWKAMLDFIKTDDGFRAQQAKSKYDLDAMSEDFDAAFEDEEAEVDPLALTADDRDLIGEALAHDDDGEVIPAGPQATTGRKLKRRPPPPKDWLQTLEMTMNGTIVANAPNLARIIQNDWRTRNVIARNQFTGETVLRGPLSAKLSYLTPEPIRDHLNGTLFTDRMAFVVRCILEEQNGKGKVGYGLKGVTDRDLNGAIEAAATEGAFHPVQEYVLSCPLVKRGLAERLFIDYLGCPDTPYYRQTAKLFLIAAIARIFEPGHKFDFVPILQGAQGKRKTTFIRILARSWFGELKADFKDEKKLVEQMMGAWINEIPELSSMAKSSVEEAKAFMSGLMSRVRLAYARRADTFLRQCVFMGSTNDDEYLIDTTGNRRFWPIKVRVDKIDTDKLERNIDMIWADAYQCYLEMREAQPTGDLPLYLTGPAAETALLLQEEARIESDSDVYKALIHEYLESPVVVGGADDFDPDQAQMKRRERVCIAELWTKALEMPNRITNEARAIGKAIRACGWVPIDKREHGEYGKVKCFGPGPEIRKRWIEEDRKTK